MHEYKRQHLNALNIAAQYLYLKVSKALEPKERIKNFDEFHIHLSKKKQEIQGSRCMACGVPLDVYKRQVSLLCMVIGSVVGKKTDDTVLKLYF